MNVRFLEHDRSAFAENDFVLGEFFRQSNGANLTAGEGELRGVFGKAESAFQAACFCLTEMAGNSRDFGVVKGENTNSVIGTDQLPTRRDTAHFFGVGCLGPNK